MRGQDGVEKEEEEEEEEEAEDGGALGLLSGEGRGQDWLAG